MGLRWLLRRLGIYPNAYYNYLKNRKAKYRQNKAKLLAIITEIYHERNGIPGYRLMTALLKNKGISLSGTICSSRILPPLCLTKSGVQTSPTYPCQTAV